MQRTITATRKVVTTTAMRPALLLVSRPISCITRLPSATRLTTQSASAQFNKYYAAFSTKTALLNPADNAAKASSGPTAAQIAAMQQAGLGGTFEENSHPVVPIADLDLNQADPPLARHVDHGHVIYTSPFMKAVHSVKMFSLTSAGMSLVSAPVMIFLSQTDTSLIARLAIATTMVTFGLGTTVVLTNVLKSYAVRLFARRSNEPTSALPCIQRDPNADEETQALDRWIITAQTLNLFAKPVYASGRLSEISPLYSRLFNNLRLESEGVPIPEAQKKKLEEEGKLEGAKLTTSPVKKDLFLHMDIATHPLLRPLWVKATIVSTTPGAIDRATREPEELQHMRASPERRLTKQQAIEELEKEKQKQ